MLISKSLIEVGLSIRIKRTPQQYMKSNDDQQHNTTNNKIIKKKKNLIYMKTILLFRLKEKENKNKT